MSAPKQPLRAEPPFSPAPDSALTPINVTPRDWVPAGNSPDRPFAGPTLAPDPETECDNCGAAVRVSRTHACEACGATLCDQCICEGCG